MALRRGKSGFTLVELLVVISIIGMLAALLMPAVQAAREAGRRNTCMNNIRQVGIACSNFSESRRHFPGYVNTIATGKVDASDSTTDGRNARTVGYLVMVLPFMERSDLYNNWTNNQIPLETTAGIPGLISSGNNFSQPYLEMLVCPSDPAPSRDLPALSYVANAGSYAKNGSTYPKKDRAEDGVFFNHAKQTSSPVKVNMDYLSSNDDSCNTLMLSENLHADCWTLRENPPSAPAAITVAASPIPTPIDAEPELQSALFNQTFMWFTPTSATPDPPPANVRINEGIDEPTPGTSPLTARPSSRHPGGVNVIFCDGHHRFIADGVDYDMFRQLMTPRGKSATCTLKAADGGNLHPLPTLDDSKY